jgi:hypothetical protein
VCESIRLCDKITGECERRPRELRLHCGAWFVAEEHKCVRYDSPMPRAVPQALATTATNHVTHLWTVRKAVERMIA